MDCRTAEDLMAGFIDGELSPGHHDLLEEHLQHCPSCSSLLEQLAEQPLAPPPMPPMGDDFWSKMDGALGDAMDAALLEEEAPAPAVVPAAKKTWRPSAALLFYAASLMFALGWGMYSHHQLQVSQAETAQLRDALDRERRLSVQPASLPVTLPGSGYQFANHTPSRGTL